MKASLHRTKWYVYYIIYEHCCRVMRGLLRTSRLISAEGPGNMARSSVHIRFGSSTGFQDFSLVVKLLSGLFSVPSSINIGSHYTLF